MELSDIGPDTGPLLYATNRADGDDRPGILILAHMDTVHPVGTLRTTRCGSRATASTARAAMT